MLAETKDFLTYETVATLESLAEVNIDSRDGFREGAEHVSNPPVVQLFYEIAEQRERQAAELRSLLSAYDVEPRKSNHAAAAAYRAWINLRGMFGGRVQAMLNEAERGEEYLREKYEKALRTTPGVARTDVLERHCANVARSHGRLRQLREQFEQTHQVTG